MSASRDYNALLEKARTTANKDEFHDIIPELLTPPALDDPVRLRLLGNAIAYNPANTSILMHNLDAIKHLLSKSTLGLQILYNGTVNNAEFSKFLITNTDFLNFAKPTSDFKNVIGSIWEALQGDIGFEPKMKLIESGFIEIIAYDTKLETNQQILKSFKEIYKISQQLSQNADENGEFWSLGFQVIGNISSHKEFGIEYLNGIDEEPFTWETVALLANLTAEKRNLETIESKFPNLVEKTVHLIKEEDPLEDEMDQLDVETGGDDEVDGEPPFDLGLWGALFRNIARNEYFAKKLALNDPVKLIERLQKSILLQSVAVEFANALASTVYSSDLTKSVLHGNKELKKLKTAICIAVYLASTTEPINIEELEWAVPKIAGLIVECLEIDQQENSWIRGTKALAMLKTKFNNMNLEFKRLEKCGPRNEAIEHNLGVCLDRFCQESIEK